MLVAQQQHPENQVSRIVHISARLDGEDSTGVFLFVFGEMRILSSLLLNRL